MQNATICKNCDQLFLGNFCNHCGQAANTHRLNIRHIWHDLQHGLFHFDNGIFYTIKQLLTRPGYAIREFIIGKRVRHFKPISFVIILASIYGLLYHFLIPNSFDVKNISTSNKVLGSYEKVINWTLDHFAYATLIMIISTTVASYLVFKKQGYNLAEHLVLNSYYRGLVLVISLLLFPVLYIFHSSRAENLKGYVPIFQIIDFVMMYWCYNQFFNRLNKIRSLGLTLLVYLFMAAINMIIAFVAGLIANAIS